MKSMRDYFFEQVQKGSYKPLTDVKLDRLVSELYFLDDPLVPLTDEQENIIKGAVKEHVNWFYNDGNSVQSKILASAGSLYLHFPTPMDKTFKKEITDLEVKVGHKYKFDSIPIIEAGEHIFVAENFLGKRKCKYDRFTEKEWVELVIPALRDLGGTYLPADERIRIFKTLEGFEPGTMKLCGTNVSVLRSDLCKDNIDRYDMRPLIGDTERHGKYADWYSYSGIVKDFKRLVKQTKTTTGKDQLTMLDVGGGRGCACYQAEQFCPEVTATNFAPTLPMALYPVNHIVGTAERMPASFKESYDIILSSWAFRYFSRVDIALENIMHALSVGGKASLNVEGDYQTQIKPQYERLDRLASEGYFKVNRRPSVLEMTKLKSL